ncbi:MAG: hypothetical protein LJE67_07880 [Salaquimonas sp.]|nr:hypothetical protein [Salaquimonas sp.]
MLPRWPSLLAAAFVILYFPVFTPAQAHDAITLFGVAVTGFPALMLHALLTPEQVFLLAAIVLIAGRMERRAFASAALALGAGMMAGKGAHLAVASLSAYWYAPLVAALAGGLTVAAFGRIRADYGIALVFILSFVLSVGIVPAQPTETGLILAVAAAILAGLICLVVIGMPLTFVKTRWGGVLIRVVGAWLAAIALLNLALAFNPAALGG